MTVIRPNSVAGINSITVQSGNSLAVHKANGELIRTLTSSSGVSTFSTLSVGTATTDNSAAKSINIGLGASIAQHNDNTLTFGTNGDPQVVIGADGSVTIKDSIIHDGDTNTKIRFVENDKISLETAGSERLRLDNQYLIKGHTSTYPIAGHYPSVQLTGTTFNDATFSIINNANDATGSYIYLSKQRSGSPGGATVVQDDDLVGQISFTAGDGTDATSRIAEIKGIVDGTPGSNDTPGRLSFWTTADGAQSSTERLRIDSSGRLLVGTTDVGYPAFADNLTLADSANCGITIRSGSSNQGNIYFSDGTGTGTDTYKGMITYAHNTDALTFATGHTGRITIDSDGAVNIGSAPAQATGTHTANAILTAKGYPGDETSAAILALVRGNNTTSTASGHTLGRIVFSDKQAGEYALIEGESEHAAAVGDTPGRLIFATTSDGATTPSEKARIDMNGDLIVHGTSLNNSAVAGQALQINGTTRPTLILRGNASGSNSGEIQFADNSGSDDDNTGIRAGLIKYDHSTNAMSFRVAGTYTGLKISGTNGRLERNFTGGSNTDDDGMWFNNSGSTSGTYIRFWQTTSGANQIGSISHGTSSTSFNTSSDYRLKENINAITDAITRLKTLKPSRFNFKTEPSVTVDGFIAHEVTAVPEAITGTKDEVDSNGDPLYQGIDQSKLVPLLTAALQEAVTKIETLETKVAALEGG